MKIFVLKGLLSTGPTPSSFITPAIVMLSERGVLGGGPWFAGQPARCRLCSTHVVLTIGVCVLAF